MDPTILTTITCPNEHCRITFSIPDGLKQRAIEDGQTVRCPNGHSMSWPGQSDVEKERKRTEHERDMRDNVEQYLYDSQDEVRDLRQLLRTCPACGWQSKRRRTDRIRADFAQHLSERHGLAVTEDLEEALS